MLEEVSGLTTTFIPCTPLRAVGLTHASKVMPTLRSNEAESLTVTNELEPLKESAPPNFPDFVQLARLPDNVRMVYKNEINKVPLLGWAMLAAGFISLDRQNIRNAMRSLDKAAQKIKKGLSIVIYPEGTRTETGEVGEFKRGMFILADKSKTDIIPVSLSNTFNLMKSGSMKVYPGTVNMVIGKPVKYIKDKELLNRIRETVINNLKPVTK